MAKRVAVITGGMGGIGQAICAALSHDYQVVATYFKQGQHDIAISWQNSMKDQGIELDIAYGNVTSYEDCEKISALVMERYGCIDVLVNNAGITQDATLKKMTPEQWHSVVDANLHSVFNLSRTVIPHMIDAHFGRIISISSINGRKGQFGQCNYSATKSALYGFSKSLALEVASHGITVNTVSPGYIETPMLEDVKPEVIKDIVAHIPIGRLGQPKDVANVIKFLASEDSEFITGANIDVNGGQYMG